MQKLLNLLPSNHFAASSSLSLSALIFAFTVVQSISMSLEYCKNLSLDSGLPKPCKNLYLYAITVSTCVLFRTAISRALSHLYNLMFNLIAL